MKSPTRKVYFFGGSKEGEGEVAGRVAGGVIAEGEVAGRVAGGSVGRVAGGVVGGVLVGETGGVKGRVGGSRVAGCRWG